MSAGIFPCRHMHNETINDVVEVFTALHNCPTSTTPDTLSSLVPAISECRCTVIVADRPVEYQLSETPHCRSRHMTLSTRISVGLDWP